ncbi:transcriptional regulator, TetR family [Seinonella peptonophila]|uniref:Transcriptional regulator, TetR family n=1 Tax=Seinonella peptonophila TaxID=112248 RepID=A0A1M5AU07_9BACL|nr:TetR/AcrR family transcriptional regulator [Seinonella peptonophila]SHF33729.1 transcriptional regulator, TetR family [Seinonella peptonophila]
MARNKYPEETINQILTVSLNLFMEKGYERTSIQDIINGLGGLTKGAIYHHFKSKEEIMQAVTERLYQGLDEMLTSIRDDKSLTGIEKLRKIFWVSLNNPSQLEMVSTAPSLMDNPRMLVGQMRSITEESVPKYIQPIVEQGLADGSIKTDYPKELSEVLMLMGNLWLNPLVFSDTAEGALNKCRFLQELSLKLGLDLLDDQMIERFVHLFRIYNEKA